jgi:hypothetical protein
MSSKEENNHPRGVNADVVAVLISIYGCIISISKQVASVANNRTHSWTQEDLLEFKKNQDEVFKGIDEVSSRLDTLIKQIKPSSGD